MPLQTGVGRTYFMNLRAAPKPQGSLNGRSKTLPKSRSSALYSRRNRPAYSRVRAHPVRTDCAYKWRCEVRTLHLDAPSDTAPLAEVVAVFLAAFRVSEALDEHRDFALERVGRYLDRNARVHL